MIKIFCITHKINPILVNNLYELMQTGKDFDLIQGIKRDNNLENISHKNPNYSELTAAYWLWKNEKNLDFIGMCHYRRYFDLFPPFFNNRPAVVNLNNENFKKTKLYKKNEEQHKKILLKYLKQGFVIVPKPQKFNSSVEQQYKENHYIEHLEQVIDLILVKQPEYKKSIDTVLEKTSLRICNMFISSKQFWDDYHKWLFTLFLELEKTIIIPKDFYQQRVYAFLSERLFNFYLVQNKVKIKAFELFFIEY